MPKLRQTHIIPIVLLPFLLLAFLLATALHNEVNSTAHAQQRQRLLLPALDAPPPGHLVIAAAYIDSTLTGEGDEAILLWNTGSTPLELAGWTLEVNGRRATFPSAGAPTLLPSERGWCTAQAVLFQITFGETAMCEWSGDSDPAVIDLQGAKLQLSNTGGWIYLRDPQGAMVDTLLYGDEVGPAPGWQGGAVQLYTRGAIGRQGQIWQRKIDLVTSLPIDNDLTSDWASDLADIAWGRRVRFPGWGGWDANDGAVPAVVTANATITIAIAPEGLYTPVAAALQSARQTIDLSLYTFEQPQLAQILADASQRGVRVRVLLEGGPAGGVTDFQRWCVRLMAQAGVDVRYLAAQENALRGLQPRYRYTHAKYGIVDGRLTLVGSENFGWDAMPVAGVGDGNQVNGGRRGAYLLTDALPVAQAVAKIFANDWAPDRFADLQPYTPTQSQFGDPPPGYTPPAPPLYPVTDAPFFEPVSAQGETHFQVISAPENALNPTAGLNALIHAAGAGDEIDLVQLYENKFWGDSDSNPIADPNPRLQALIEAARRGAKVRLLLDGFFDEGEALRSNQATADYLAQIAAAEGIDIEAKVGNPTGGGIHAKWLLMHVGGVKWSAVGSLNGGEISHKLNREVVLMTDHPAVYARLLEVFLHDWVLITR